MDEIEEEVSEIQEPVIPEEDEPSVFLDVAQAPFRGVEGALHGAYNLADMVAFDVLPDWDTRFLGTSKTTAGSLVEGVAQFATGFVPIFGAAGKIGALAKAGTVTRGVVAGAVTDFTAFKGQEDRLSNLIQQFPELQNPVTEFLAHDADESEVEGRLKNVLEGLILEGAIGGTVSLFMKSLRALKAGKKVRDIDGLGPDEVNKATSDALEDGKAFEDIAEMPDFDEGDSIFLKPRDDEEATEYIDMWQESLQDAQRDLDDWMQKVEKGEEEPGDFMEDILRSRVDTFGQNIEKVKQNLETEKARQSFEEKPELQERVEELDETFDDLEEAIATRPPPFQTYEDAGMLDIIPRGAEDITGRLMNEQPVKGASAQDVRDIRQFIKVMGVRLFSDVAQPMITNKIPAGGQFEFGSNLLKIRQSIVEEGSLKRVMVHELWHSLSRYLPKEDLTRLTKEFNRERNKYIQSFGIDVADLDSPFDAGTVQIKEIPEELKKFLRGKRGGFNSKNYRFKDIDEYFAEEMTDAWFKKMDESDLAPSGTFKRTIQEIAILFKDMFESLKSKLGIDQRQKIFNDFLKQRNVKVQRQTSLKGFESTAEMPDFKAKIKTDPEWQQWTDAVLKGESPTLPRLEVVGDIDSAHKILTEKYKQNPELLKKFDEGEAEFLDDDLNQLFKLGAQSIKDRRRIRVESEIFKDLLRGSNERLMQAVKAFEETESLQSEAALRNQLSEFVEIYDYYRQMGAEDSKNLAMRRQKKPISRKIGLERSELQNTALVKEFLNNESGGMSAQKAAKLIKEMYDPNNAEASIKKILGLSKKVQGKHLLDVPSEYWINSLLSGPRTQAVNFLGNALTQALGTIEMTTGAILTGNLPLAKAAIASWADYVLWKEAFSAAFKTLVTGKEVLDVGSRTLESSRQAIGDVVDLRRGLDESKSFNQKTIDILGGVVNLPARGLLTGDELFKQLAFRRAARLKAGMEAINLGMKDPKEISGYVADKLNKVVATNGQVMSQEALIREATKQADDLGLVGVQFAKQRSDHIKNYVDQNFDEDASILASYALDEAKYFTHTRELEEGTLGKGIQNLSKSWPMLRFIVPFVRTPTNLLSFAFERSPLAGSVRVPGTDKILNVPGLRSEAMALREGLKSSDPVIKSAAMGKVVTSFSVAGMLFDLVLNNNEVLPVITGGGPTDERQKKILEETGWRPYSILYDGKYYSYQRLDPIATLLGTTADVSEMLKEDQEANKGPEDMIVTMATAISRNLSNKSYLAGIQLWADAFQEPERFGDRVLRNYAGSSIPNIFSQAQDYDKQALREVRDVADAILKKTPGGREMLDPKRNILGEEKIIDYGTFGFINPIASAEDKGDPILQEMAELQHGFRMPSSKMLGGNVDLLEYANEKGQSAYDRRLELLKDVTIGGRTLRQALTKLIKSSSYKKLPGFDSELGVTSPRVQQITKVLNKYKNIAQREMLREFPELSSKIRNTNLALRYNKQGVSREDVLALLTQ
jgi:hypothetical protein